MDIRKLRAYQIGGYTLGVGFMLLQILLPQILEGFSQLDIRYMAIYASVLLLLAGWVWSTWNELDLLNLWFKPGKYVAPSSLVEAVSMLFFVLILCGLLLTVKEIAAFAALFSIYAFVGIFLGGVYMLSEIGGALKASMTAISTWSEEGARPRDEILIYEKAYDIIKSYWGTNLDKIVKDDHAILCRFRFEHAREWFGNLYLMRLVFIFLAGAAVTGLAFYEHCHPSERLETIAYFCMVGVIVIAEMWINVWRFRRDVRLRGLQEKLLEVRSDEV